MRGIGSAVLLAAALTLMSSGMARAQDAGTALPNPNQYTQEDSHPVRVIGYLLSPIGVALEYTVARPLHYLATNTFMQPVLDPARDSDNWVEFYGGGAGGSAVLPPVPTQAEADQNEQGLGQQDLGTDRLLPKPIGPTAGTSNDSLPPAPKNAGQPIMH
jgi:hypothetical protein